MPYRYLHPPAALAGVNHPPLSGTRSISRAEARSGKWFSATSDGQVVVAGRRDAIALPSRGRALVLHVTPVDVSVQAPPSSAVDGNVYRITARWVPGNVPATLSRSLSLTMRWPHIPTGISRLDKGHWVSICTSGNATITPSTISCALGAFGTVAVLTSPSNIGHSPPVTPISHTPAAGLNSYLAVLAAIAVLVVSGIGVFLLTRPDKSGTDGEGNSSTGH